MILADYGLSVSAHLEMMLASVVGSLWLACAAGPLITFLVYRMTGQWTPCWLPLSGFGLEEAVEILSMSLDGMFEVRIDTSVQFVFCLILYSAIGGDSC